MRPAGHDLVNVGRAKTIAQQWVEMNAAPLPGFRGAFLHGSINWRADDAQLPATSDVDLIVIIEAPNEVQRGKLLHQGLVLDVSTITPEEVADAETVLPVSHLAGSFASSRILADPGGQLGVVQRAVARDYPARDWVWRRCQHAAAKVPRFFGGLSDAAPLHSNAIAWAFGTSVTTHILLCAGLRNPTVRTRYVAARKLLVDVGYLDHYEHLLSLFGCAAFTQSQAENHLTAMAAAFDAANTVSRTPVVFASDITDLARPMAIDASRGLISEGLHREAVFWIVITFARSLTILGYDAAPDVMAIHESKFRDLLADLGIDTIEDFTLRATKVNDDLRSIWAVTENILRTCQTM